MADWNTSSSPSSPFKGLFSDPKKVMFGAVGLGAVLMTGFALTFGDKPEKAVDANAVTFTIPDAGQRLPQPVDGGALHTLPLKKSGDPEADAMNALHAAAVKDAAGGAKAGDTESETPYDAEDETGAPGGPIGGEEAAGSMGSFGGFGNGGSASGGIPAYGPGAAASPAAPGEAGVPGAAPALAAATLGRMAGSTDGGRRQGAAGRGGVRAIGADLVAQRRPGPGGAAANTYGAAGGGAAAPVTAGGAGALGAGAGFAGTSGRGDVATGGAGPQIGGGGGGAGAADAGGGGSADPGPLRKRADVKKDAAAVLKTAKTYKTTVVQKIMAEEKADLQAVSVRSRNAHVSLKADDALLKRSIPSYAALPAVAQHLSEAQEVMAQQFPKFKEGADTLKQSLKTLTKVPGQCSGKKTVVAYDAAGVAADPAGVLNAHREAMQALRRVAVARVTVSEISQIFKEQSAVDAPLVEAVDPRLAVKYRAMVAKIRADLDVVAKQLPPNLYPTKGTPAAAKASMEKKLTPIRKSAEKGLVEITQRQSEIVNSNYGTTKDAAVTMQAINEARDAAFRVVMSEAAGQDTLFGQAETFLPPLVKAGEYAAESYLSLCDTYAGLTALTKSAPKN